MSVDRVEFLCLQPQDVMTAVVCEVLSVVRPTITVAWIDAFSDGGWQDEQQPDVDALLALEQRLLAAGQRRKANGMGIDLDVTRDDQFQLLVRLAAHTIHAEAWADDQEVFSASDTGDHAWFALTPPETSDAAARLAASGLVFEDVLTFFK